MTQSSGTILAGESRSEGRGAGTEPRNAWNLPWEGGCRCGQVRLRITAPPLLTMACHCMGCQRMTASAFSLSAAIPTEGFAITKGKPVIGGLHGETRHYFCPHCLSWMFTLPEGLDDFVNIRTTMLDDAPGLEPFIETCTREKLPWAETPAVHSFEMFPDEEDYAGLVEEYARRTSVDFSTAMGPQTMSERVATGHR